MNPPNGSDHSGDRQREWDARSYHVLSEPQFEWGRRVASQLVLSGSERVLDAGAGTGRLTSLLAERLPKGYVVALDRSLNMTRVAQETLSRFQNTDIVAAELLNLPFADAFDVVFSTATFHWVLDHDRLFAELHAALRQGGRLHAQCGGTGNLVRMHHRALDLAASSDFAQHFANWKEPWEFASAEVTRERLARAGFRDIETWIEDAPITFPDAPAFRAFISTVVMRPFLARLPTGEQRSAFLDRIVDQAAGDDPSFTLDYRRLNLVGTRS